MRNIVVEDLKQTPLEKQRIEIVERKGLGHPDYICVPPDTLIIGNLSIQQISSFKVGDKVNKNDVLADIYANHEISEEIFNLLDEAYEIVSDEAVSYTHLTLPTKRIV